MFAHFFIERPIAASVVSIVIVVVGAIAYTVLPIAQYPEIAPPTVQVVATWNGASAQDVSTGVAIPIEKQVNGVENMLYMESRCTNDGQMNMIVTFAVGTDLNMAQVLVQNRVSMAMAKLPDSVKQTGVTVNKQSPSILLVINFYSQDGSREPLYLSNYVQTNVKDEIARVKGVGNVNLFGEREYSMRINLDPLKLAIRGLTPTDVIQAVREQNQQVAAGQIGQPPVPKRIRLDFQNTINVFGRLSDVKQFEDIVLKTVRDPNSGSVRVIKLKEVAEIELGAKAYDMDCSVDGKPSVGLAIYQLPGSNALETAQLINETLAKMRKRFPPGVNADIYYDTTPFITESIHEVEKTLRDAIILVAIVVLLFLQSWRAALIPLIAVPVSIIGTCAFLALFDFSLNNLTLFGLVLAIGIVVDDAIVVVENVEHQMEHGLAPREASHKAMSEVSGAVIAITIVLISVFIPCAFISGIQGQFFKQFALTIAMSSIISGFNSLTLSPALCALLLKPKTARPDLLQRLLNNTIGFVFRAFNKGFDYAAGASSQSVKRLLRASVIVLLLYGGLLYCTGYMFTKVPTGFIPAQDKGYLIADIQLPDSMALGQTLDIAREFDEIVHTVKGVRHTIGIPGQSAVTGAFNSNTATFYIILDEFDKRHGDDLYADAIAMEIRKKSTALRGAHISVFGAPAVDGLGNAGGFKMQIQDRGGLGFDSLAGIADKVAFDANAQKGLIGVFSSFRANTPQIRLDIDRANVKAKGVNLDDLFKTLESTLGSYYVNDITFNNNNYQVKIQSRSDFRMRVEDVGMIRVRNQDGKMIALSTFANAIEESGPSMVTRYNTYPSAPVMGGSLPGVSSGQALSMMDQVCDKDLPQQMSYEWTDLSYQQIRSGNTAIYVFAFSVLLVFLVLSFQYESFVLPLSVILIVPMCILCAVTGIAIAKMDINIFTQIGLIVLVGLASKNAILIVEFAKQKREGGASAAEAAVEACRLRLRPIMMTSFAFILGVLPLVISTGAGAEMRKTLGTAVFSGMLGVTFFGIFLTPVFYFVLQWLTSKDGGKAPTP